MNLGMTELIVIFAIILVLFGGRRLPGLGKAIGDTIREFKKGIGGEEEERVERQAQQLPANDSKSDQKSEQKTEQTQSEKEKNRT